MFPSNFVTQQMDTPAPVEQPVAKEPVKITQVHIRSIFHELSIIPKSKDYILRFFLSLICPPQVNPQQIDLLLEMLRNADATVTNEEEDAYIAELESQVEQQVSNYKSRKLSYLAYKLRKTVYSKHNCLLNHHICKCFKEI